MKTPKKYMENLENGIITEEMLGECLYSVNKRAKNCREQQMHYRYSHSRYARENSWKYRAQKERYYELKDEMLSILEPERIHKEFYEGSWHYYLLYAVGTFSFHHPITEEQLEQYSSLEIQDIGELKTNGQNIDSLLSVQFVEKVCSLIHTGNYSLV